MIVGVWDIIRCKIKKEVGMKKKEKVPKCPNCGGVKTQKHRVIYTLKGVRSRRQCLECGKTFNFGPLIPYEEYNAGREGTPRKI